MSINPQEYVPISESPVRRARRAEIAIPITLLAMAVIFGLGITAFSSSPIP
jgi:hypothetical protein